MDGGFFLCPDAWEFLLPAGIRHLRDAGAEEVLCAPFSESLAKISGGAECNFCCPRGFAICGTPWQSAESGGIC